MDLILLVPVEIASTGGRAPGDTRTESSMLWAAGLAKAISQTFRTGVTYATRPLDPGFALDVTRNQYLSSAILQRLAALGSASGDTVLGVTSLDIFVPVFTYVFGEAQLEGRAALISTHRLRQEFYGLPASQQLLEERLRKEALHELGHTRGLHHCRSWDCVMASAHSVDRLDIRGERFCPACRAQIAASTAMR